MIFVSYARRERTLADRIDAALRSRGCDTWRDVRDLDPYADLSAEIERAIEAADHVVVCLTADVAKRQDSFVRREIAYALQVDRRRRSESPPRALPIIPVVFPGGELPVLISTHIALAATAGAGVETLAEMLDERLRKPAPRPAPPPTIDPPELVAHLEDLHAWACEQLAATVERLLELGATERPQLVDRRPRGPKGFSVSPALAPMRAALVDRSPGAPSPPRSFATTRAAFEHHGGRLLLVGPPGSGKTTTLLAFARQAAVDRLTDRRAPVPVLRKLADWNKQPGLLEWAIDGAHFLRDRPLLLLLDGLDELRARRGSDGDTSEAAAKPDAAQAALLAKLADEYPTGSVVLSSRSADFAALGTPARLSGAVELSTLSDAQIQEYLAGTPVEASAVLANAALAQMARNPLHLALLRATAGTGQPAASEVSTEVEIFDAFVHGRFLHEAAHGEPLPFSEERTRDWLGRLAALRFLEKQGYSLDKEDLARVAGKQAAAFADFAERMHFLRVDRRDRFSALFVHLKFHDYFATPELLLALDRPKEWRRRWPKKQFKAREMDAEFALTRVGGFAVPGLLRIVEGGSDDDAERSVIQWTAIRMLGQIGASAVGALVHLLRAGHQERRSDVIKALGEAGGPGAVAALSALLDGPDDEPALRALGDTCCDDATKPLLARLRSGSGPRRGVALKALWELAKHGVAVDFGEFLGDADVLVARWAAVGRGVAGDVTAGDMLVAALDDGWWEPDAIDALAKSPHREATAVLTRAAEAALASRPAKPDEFGRDGVPLYHLVVALGSRRDPRTVDVLARCQLDPDPGCPPRIPVRDAARMALKALGSPAAQSLAADASNTPRLLALLRSLPSNPQEAIDAAATRVLANRAPRGQRTSAACKLAAVARIVSVTALVAAPLWWPAVLVAVAAYVAGAYAARRRRIVVVVRRGFLSGFWLYRSGLEDRAGRIGHLIDVSGDDTHDAENSGVSFFTFFFAAGLALATATTLSLRDPWRIPSLAFLLLCGTVVFSSAIAGRRFRNAASFSVAFLIARFASTPFTGPHASATHMVLSFCLLALAVRMVIGLVVPGGGGVKAGEVLGTSEQIGALARELQGAFTLFPHWLKADAAGLDHVRCVGWTWRAAVRVAVAHADAVIAVKDKMPEEDRAYVAKVCAEERIKPYWFEKRQRD